MAFGREVASAGTFSISPFASNMSPPNPRDVLLESPPIAAIMLFWLVVSWLAPFPPITTGIRAAGVVMALLYAVVRGLAVAERGEPSLSLGDYGTVLRVNGLALLAAAGWFVLARLVLIMGVLWTQLGLPGLFTSPAGGLLFAFSTTGVLTVVLYAVAFGAGALDGGFPPERRSAPDGSPVGD